MSKTTVQISAPTAAKLKRVRKEMHLPMGTLADIGLRFVADGINKGELLVSNGKVVRAQAEPETPVGAAA